MDPYEHLDRAWAELTPEEREQVMNAHKQNAVMEKHAQFSACGKYRYYLSRIWNPHADTAMCIGLNPSTANASEDDPTIRRLISDLTYMGYGGFYMCNLYALISSKPEALSDHPDPVGDNEKWMEEISCKAEHIIFCWGQFKQAKYRAEIVKKMFPDALCFGWTKDGSPMHPLALMYAGIAKEDVFLRKFNQHPKYQ